MSDELCRLARIVVDQGPCAADPPIEVWAKALLAAQVRVAELEAVLAEVVYGVGAKLQAAGFDALVTRAAQALTTTEGSTPT